MFFRFNLLLVVFVVFCQFAFAQEVKVTLGELYKSKRSVLLGVSVFKDNKLFVTDGFDLKVVNMVNHSVTKFDLKVDKEIYNFIGLILVEDKIRMFYGIENKSENQIEVISFLLNDQTNTLGGNYDKHFVVKNTNKFRFSSLIYSPDSMCIAVTSVYKNSDSGYNLFYGVIDQNLTLLHSGKLDFPPNANYNKYGERINWVLNNNGSLLCAQSLGYGESKFFFIKSSTPSALRYTVLDKLTMTPKLVEIDAEGGKHVSFFFKVNKDNDFEAYTIFKTEAKEFGIGLTTIDAEKGTNDKFVLGIIKEADQLSLKKYTDFISEKVSFEDRNIDYYIHSIRYDSNGNPIFFIQQELIMGTPDNGNVGSGTAQSNYHSGEFMAVKMSASLDKVIWASVLNKYHITSPAIFEPMILYGDSTLAAVYESFAYLKGEKNKNKTSMRVWYVDLNDGKSKNERLKYKLKYRSSALTSSSKKVSDTKIKSPFVDWGFGTYKDFYFGELELIE